MSKDAEKEKTEKPKPRKSSPIGSVNPSRLKAEKEKKKTEKSKDG